jgi:hypothetical protein
LAELLGATGVIITLVYLTFQLRQNTKAMRSATFQQLSDSMSDSARLLMERPEVLKLLVHAEADGFVSDEEKATFHFYAMIALRRYETAFVQGQLQVVNPSLIEGFERSTLALFESPLWRSWWSENKHFFGSDFAGWIDGHLSSGESAATHFFMNKDGL